jgi:nucleoid-associated protein YgaU
VTREQKLALIVGFSLILLVGVLISDHLSRARAVQVAGIESEDLRLAADTRPNLPDAIQPAVREVAAEPQPAGPLLPPAALPAQPGDAGQSTDSPGTLIAMGPATAEQAGTIPLREAPPPSDRAEQLLNEFRSGIRSAIGEAAGLDIPAAATLDRVETLTAAPAPEKLATEAPARPATQWYTVKPGETLFQIAKRQYGSGSMWKQLAELNKGRVTPDGGVRAGVRIELFESVPGASPAKSPSTPAKPAAKPAPRSSGEQRLAKDTKSNKPRAATYTVQRGDSIGEISQKVLGTVKRKDEILSLNRGIVDDEDSIQVGMVLKMPAR